MKVKLFLVLAVLFGVGSAFTTSLRLTDKYVIISGVAVSYDDAVQQNRGQCVTSGAFCTYVLKSNPPNPTDLSDPANYERDPDSMDEHFEEN
jgi:hypothetical protein